MNALEMTDEEKRMRNNPKGKPIFIKVPMNYMLHGTINDNGVDYIVYMAPLKTDDQILNEVLSYSYDPKHHNPYINADMNLEDEKVCLCCERRFKITMFTKGSSIYDNKDLHPVCRYCWTVTKDKALEITTNYGKLKVKDKESFMSDWINDHVSSPLIAMDSQ